MSRGKRIGRYTVGVLLGSGGMGEVYRARDETIGREVAIKLLPAVFAADANRLLRFEQEVRAAGRLNHPNILAIHDVGTHEGAPFLVSELLEGETLRGRLKVGPLPVHRAVDFAIQILHGLSAAHQKGILHRDLKPENLFVTTDGRIKILDFGLAKLTRSGDERPAGDPAVAESLTESGTLLGTAGYMSPEQVRGQALDPRSDLFSVGAVLFEMISGRRAFRGDSIAETWIAILHEEPASILSQRPDADPELERVVRHCLEKSPEDRYRCADDLAFDLSRFQAPAPPASNATRTLSAARDGSWSAGTRTAAALILATLLLAGGVWAGRRTVHSAEPSFQRLTFGRGTVLSARFAADGRTVIYGASWNGDPIRLFSTRAESAESTQLPLPDAEILAISPSGEMAISLARRYHGLYDWSGTLARVPLAGGAPREVLDDVQWADWGDESGGLAVVRNAGGKNRLEYPIGRVLAETTGWLSHPRFSPDRARMAFLEHPAKIDSGGSVILLDLSGRRTVLSKGWQSIWGLAWSPNGSTVWVTGTRVGADKALWSVALSGRERLIARIPGTLKLQDVSREGRALLVMDASRMELVGHSKGDARPRDLTWRDWSLVRDISPDSRVVLFTEGAGHRTEVFLRSFDGSPAVRLGEGAAEAISPDGRFALTIPLAGGGLQVLPLRAGAVRSVPVPGVAVHSAAWLPDGRRIVVLGNAPGRGVRLYVQELSGGTPRPITPEGVAVGLFPQTAGGREVLACGPDGSFAFFPVDAGPPRPLAGLPAGAWPTRVRTDGSVDFFRPGAPPFTVSRLDPRTGKIEPWKELTPSDPSGVLGIISLYLSADGSTYAYSYVRMLSDLYLAEGLR